MNNVVSALRRSFRRRGGAAAKKRQETRQKQQEQDETTATTRTSREDLLDCEDEVGVIRREREKEEREREMRRRALKAAKSEADILAVKTVASKDGAEAAEVAGAKSEINLLTAQDIVGDEEEEKKAEEEDEKVEMEKEEKEEEVHKRSDRGRTSLIGCLCFEEKKYWQVFFLLDEAGCFVSVFPSFFPQNHFPPYSPSFPPTL